MAGIDARLYKNSPGVYYKHKRPADFDCEVRAGIMTSSHILLEPPRAISDPVSKGSACLTQSHGAFCECGLEPEDLFRCCVSHRSCLNVERNPAQHLRVVVGDSVGTKPTILRSTRFPPPSRASNEHVEVDRHPHGLVRSFSGRGSTTT